MSPEQLLVLFFVSLAANLLSALAGGGAGLLQLPALLMMGLPFATALATHKIASVALGVGAGFRHLRTGSVSARRSLAILGAGLPGVWVGAHLILGIPERQAELMLGLLTLGLGVYSFISKGLGLAAEHRTLSPAASFTGYAVLFGIGVLNGSLTSGTGLFVTIWLVRWFGLGFGEAVAYTLILVGVFWNGLGALALGLQAPVAWLWLPALLAGSLLGGYAGAHMALLKGNGYVKRAFEILTVVVGLKLISDAMASLLAP